MSQVSVIIPTYNRAGYLRSAIRSVLNQTFQDFEIIVVDDASTDNTPEVVNCFDNKRIKYIRHNVNKGGSAARNTGIVNSGYEYIAFLDDDDEWLPEKLKMQVDILGSGSTKLGGVYTGHLMVENNTGKVLRVWTPKRRGSIYNDMFSRNWISTTSSVLLRRVCFDRVGLFDSELPSFQDYDMWIRVSKEFDFEYIDQPLLKYRVHGNKIWTNLEALKRGMELMLEKYGESPAFRKNYSYYYLNLGVCYCYQGDTKKGRKEFLRAIKLFPFEIRHYFNLCLSLMGADNFRTLKEVKEKLVASVRNNKML